MAQAAQEAKEPSSRWEVPRRGCGARGTHRAEQGLGERHQEPPGTVLLKFVVKEKLCLFLLKPVDAFQSVVFYEHDLEVLLNNWVCLRAIRSSWRTDGSSWGQRGVQ